MDNPHYNRIKAVLAEKDKTGTWLSEQMGRNIETVSRWMTNKVQPSVEPLGFATCQSKNSMRLHEDEYGYHGTSYLSGEIFSTSILDNIDRFVDKFETIMMCRKLAKSLDLELYCCAEKGIKRLHRPDIIIEFPAGVIALDENYLSETREEKLYRIPSGNYVGIDENGYEEVFSYGIGKALREFIEDYYKVDLFEVED